MVPARLETMLTVPHTSSEPRVTDTKGRVLKGKTGQAPTKLVIKLRRKVSTNILLVMDFS